MRRLFSLRLTLSKVWIISSLVISTSFAQSINLPDLGDESSAQINPQFERQVGAELYRLQQQDPNYWDDPEIDDYLQNLSYLLLHSMVNPIPDLRLFLIRDNTINAFAMPGGYIGINSGLILAAQTESELVSVLTHEIGHVSQHHLARMVSAGQKTGIATLAGAILCLLASRSNSQATQACVATAVSLPTTGQLTYSRDFEREADRIGFDTLQRAGFDPKGASSFFERMQRTEVSASPGGTPAYLRSHPLTVERIADTWSRSLQANVASSQTNNRSPLSFYAVKARIQALHDLSFDGVNASRLTLQAELKREKLMGSSAHYGLALLQVEQKNYSQAKLSLEAARKEQIHPMYDMLEARILLLKGESNSAQLLLKQSIQNYPDTSYLKLALVRTLQSFNQAEKHRQALEILERLISDHPNQSELYLLQAHSWEALQEPIEQMRSQAEYQFQKGQIPSAVRTLHLALCVPNSNFYQQSIIQARIKTMQQLFAEQQPGILRQSTPRNRDPAETNEKLCSGNAG